MPRKGGRNTKGRIVSAAWKLFYEQGYDDTTVEDIILESATSRGSFYHYFEGKDALLGSLSDRPLVTMEEHVLLGGFGIVKEPLLSLASQGILSYHHGNMRKYRGQPVWGVVASFHGIVQRVRQLAHGGDEPPVFRRDAMDAETSYNRRGNEIHRCRRKDKQQNRNGNTNPGLGQFLKRPQQSGCNANDDHIA